jgi:hypothetical protein
MSIAGVILAGAVALAANLGILNSTNQVGTLSAADDSTSSTTTQAGAAEEVAYQIAGIGVVTLARQGDDLTLQSADVGDWTYEVNDSDDGISITFRLGEREIEFEAEVEDGQTFVSVNEEDVIVQDGTGSALPPGSTSFDDDSISDDDEFESDDDSDAQDHEDEDEDEHEDEDDHEEPDD